jgi:hypothetical protein
LASSAFGSADFGKSADQAAPREFIMRRAPAHKEHSPLASRTIAARLTQNNAAGGMAPNKTVTTYADVPTIQASVLVAASNAPKAIGTTDNVNSHPMLMRPRRKPAINPAALPNRTAATRQ